MVSTHYYSNPREAFYSPAMSPLTHPRLAIIRSSRNQYFMVGGGIVEVIVLIASGFDVKSVHVDWQNRDMKSKYIGQKDKD